MTTAEPLTPERRRELTRRHLLDAAAAEFALKGFHGASLDAVAKAAGFTKGAVYSNFENKADLFLAVLDDHSTLRSETVAKQVVDDGGSPEARVARMQEAISAAGFDEGWIALWLEFVLYAARHPEARVKLAEFRRRQQALAEQLIAEGYGHAGLEPEHPIPLLALVSVAIYDGLDVQRLIDPESVTPAVEEAVLAYLYETVGTDAVDAAVSDD
jgi:AcrR family transcriptional regulator